MAGTADALSETLCRQLQKETLVILNTVDAGTGGPTANAISWICAVSPKKLRMALDQRSRLVDNIRQHPAVTLSLFGSGSFYAIHGKASIIANPLEGVPIKLVCIDVDIDAVHDAMFFGARITAEPEFVKTYDKRAADRLDGQVFAAMRKAQ